MTMTEWLIHRFVCPDCDSDAYADRPIGCWNCGTQMENEDYEVSTIEVDHD